MAKLLQILIPTYNRMDSLARNLSLLIFQISSHSLYTEVGIVIRDNGSTDGTGEMVKRVMADVPSIDIILGENSSNLGLEKNVVAVLSDAKSDYVMFLGDDDYLPEDYIRFVLSIIRCGEVNAVIPGYSAYLSTGEVLPRRNEKFPIAWFPSGKNTLRKCVAFGHQLSGLVYRRAGLLDAYLKNDKYRNVYPFVFWLAYCAIRGGVLYAPTFKVKVTQFNVKDWKYDDAGLLNEIFKNFIALFPKSKINRFICEYSFIKDQPWRFRPDNRRAHKSAVLAIRGGGACTALGLILIRYYNAFARVRSILAFLAKKIRLI